ncbi:MAG TPA: thrombospondin type 3 repeat-containing protein [Polyangiaceae bacterium]|nr:thrombospondin type 3 repeat-containing protein [Polyangiaceae bacterium]
MKSHTRHSTFFKRPSSWLALGTCAASAVIAASANAQQVDGTFNVQRFDTAAGPRNYWVTRGARSDGENAISFGLMPSYAYRPFVVDSITGRHTTSVPVVENLVSADVLFSYTPISPLQIGLRVPVTYAKGQGITPQGGAGQLENAAIDKFGLSDPELEVKFRFVGEADSPFTMGAAAFVTAPLGEATAKGAFIGSKSLTGGGRLIFDFLSGGFGVAANAGFRGQQKGRIGQTEIGSEAFYSLGLGYQIGPAFQLVGDLFGASALSSAAGANPMELAVGGRITPLNSPIAISFGGGPGLIQAIGGPSFRAFVGFAYIAEAMDDDADLISNSADQCPTEAEDVDGYEDSDGCPDRDNDGDAIEDSADKCANEAEDIDGFQDQDGCPEKDNDKDGFDDTADHCPLEAENLNGFKDEDGCPDIPDSDADGVPDDKDQCPKEAEDTDGFEDVDGCPDLDNDKDGVPDDKDECIDQAETPNGFEDEDGCPDTEPPKGSRGRAKSTGKSSKPAGGGKGTEANPIEL